MYQNKYHHETNDDLIKPINTQIIYCNRHRKQRITHICSESKCQNNPLICQQCISENILRSYHYQHETAILPLNEGIEKICRSIKYHINPLNKIYKTTIAKGQNVGILSKIEKNQIGYYWQKNQLAERISSIKNQIQVELEVVRKQFEKILCQQRQQFIKILDNYQKAYLKNIEYIKSQVKPLIDYEYSIRYYSNMNNLQLKIANENKKKSDWLSRLKKSINMAAKTIENTSYSSEINSLLHLANKSKIDMWPFWKNQQNSQKSISLDLKYFIKRTITQWVYVPQLKNLQEQNQNQLLTGIGSKMNLRIYQNNQNFTKNYFSSKNKL